MGLYDNAYAEGTPLLRHGKRYSGKFPVRHWYRGWNPDMGRHEIGYIFYDRSSRKWREDTRYESEMGLYSYYEKAGE